MKYGVSGNKKAGRAANSRPAKKYQLKNKDTMSTEIQKTEPTNGVMKPMTVKDLFSRDDVRKRFQEMLGKRASAFLTSVLQIVSQNKELVKADPHSIYHSAAVAATLDLPLNNNLGFAYIVPYNSKQADGTYKVMAQFQMGYKGFIQLAQRSGQFITINSSDVREGEIKEQNRLTGEIEFNWLPDVERTGKAIVGFVAYFKLLNGFEKSLYMTVDELKKHGGRYSKTFANKYGLWTTDFEAMAHKTVTKLLLGKFGPLSIEMQKAVMTDQSVINNEEGTDVTYIDHEEVKVDKEAERVILLIGDCKTMDELIAIKETLPEGCQEAYETKFAELSEK